ncbi:hypothetical protein HDE_11680 [Halotydeus destructor]|nr:hypothetical protein HDE_11680 [Halotydeus destructor]
MYLTGLSILWAALPILVSAMTASKVYTPSLSQEKVQLKWPSDYPSPVVQQRERFNQHPLENFMPIVQQQEEAWDDVQRDYSPQQPLTPFLPRPVPHPMPHPMPRPMCCPHPRPFRPMMYNPLAKHFAMKQAIVANKIRAKQAQFRKLSQMFSKPFGMPYRPHYFMMQPPMPARPYPVPLPPPPSFHRTHYGKDRLTKPGSTKGALVGQHPEPYAAKRTGEIERPSPVFDDKNGFQPISKEKVFQGTKNSLEQYQRGSTGNVHWNSDGLNH